MIFKSIFVYPRYPEKLQKLYKLASNLWCTWNYDAVGLFYRIDARLFREVNHNPIKFLHSLSKEKLNDLASDKGFLFEFERVWEEFEHYLSYAGTYKDADSEYNLKKTDIVAYFSMEYGLHEAIPIYAGGLGVLAGDYLKGVSDMDLPVIGIGLLYKFGYFTQRIDMNGYQQEIFSSFENHLIPIREIHDSKGDWARINIRIRDDEVKAKLWKIDIGKTGLVLLDTDIEDNPPHLRDITNELYVSDREKRIQQELILGIGGIKALEMLGIDAKIYHFNEGHSGFAVIGRLRTLMKDRKFSFSEAKTIIRASTVFTTHTPVIAGNENLETSLVKSYLKNQIEDMGLSFDEIASLGYVNDNTRVFWLPAFAMHFSKYINAVSNQHCRISRKMWAGIFPESPIVEIPISSVTNGVHTSWISPPFNDLFKRYLGPDYALFNKKEDVWKNIYNIPDQHLWDEHRRNKKDMINFIRRRFSEQIIARGYSQSRTFNINRVLNVDHLTIVFARRFAGYKRPALILRDRERFRKILTNPAKPVQMIFAGKAHPADEQSKRIIKEVLDYAKEYDVEDRVIFLENYDINIARHLYWGADLWLNNPAQDMEASGTSGMKAAMNGVLHLSTYEGWWLEGYNGKNGWVLTAGRLFNKYNLQEAADANQLYDLLEHQITEIYYNRIETDLSPVWVKMMKDSIYSVCSNFNINRVLSDYLKKCYIPSIKATADISGNNYALLRKAARQEQNVLKHWDDIQPAHFTTNLEKKDHITEGESVEIECGVKFGQADPKLFTVELFYIYDQAENYKVLTMQQTGTKAGLTYYKYSLQITNYGPQSLNVRIKPANAILRDIHPELIKWLD